MHDPLRTLPGYGLRRASVAMMNRFSEMLRPLGIKYTESSILILIGSNPGIRQSDLTHMLDIQRANLTPIIAQMEGRNLIMRTRIDGRSWGLDLTETGKEMLDAVWKATLAHEADLIGRVPEACRPALLIGLNALWDEPEGSAEKA